MMNKVSKIYQDCGSDGAACRRKTSCFEKLPSSSIPEDQAMKTFNDAVEHLTGIYVNMPAVPFSAERSHLSLTYRPIWCMPLTATPTPTGPSGAGKCVLRIWKSRGVYASLYAVIGSCNFFLEHIDDVRAAETSDANLDLLDNYQGQVYAVGPFAIQSFWSCSARLTIRKSRAKGSSGCCTPCEIF